MSTTTAKKSPKDAEPNAPENTETSTNNGTTTATEPSESDAAAETAMNAGTTEETENEATDPDVVALPENPYNVMMEIMKHPAPADAGFGEDAYEIQLESASNIFKDRKSGPSMFNSAKQKLTELKIIEEVRKKTKEHPAIVRVLNSKVKLKVGGQGRKAGAPSRPNDGTGPRRPGRPRKDGTQPAPAGTRSVGRPKTVASVDDGTVSIELLREKLQPNPDRIESYLKAMANVLKYPDLFESQFQLKK